MKARARQPRAKRPPADPALLEYARAIGRILARQDHAAEQGRTAETRK